VLYKIALKHSQIVFLKTALGEVHQENNANINKITQLNKVHPSAQAMTRPVDI